MKTLSLNIGERIIIDSSFNQFKEGGLGLSDLRMAMKILEKVEITPDEVKKVGLNSKKETGKITWDDDKYTKDIEFSDEQATFIDNLLKKKDEEKKFSISEGVIILGLIDKIRGEKDGSK